MPAAEALDVQVLPGISLFFVLIFFVPLALVAIAFWGYCAFARKSVIRAAKMLSLTWCIASVPAALLITMGNAFNSSAVSPLLAVPLWLLAGLLVLWLPVGLRAACRIRPV